MFSPSTHAFRELWQDGRGWVLFAVSGGWFLSQGVRVTYPAVLPFLRDEFHISLSVAGALLAVLTGAYALGQLPGGLLGDRYGERKVLITATIFSAIAVLLVSISPYVTILFFGTFVFGISSALYGPTRFTIFTRIYDSRVGSAMGFTLAAGSMGNAVLPIGAVAIASYISWRLSFGLLFPLFVTASIAIYYFVPRSPLSHKSDIFNTIELLSYLRATKIRTIITIQVLISFVWNGFVGFFPTYLMTVKGISPGTSALLFGLFFSVAIIVQPVAGILLDKFGERISLITIIGFITVGLSILPFATNFTLIIALTILLSTLNGVGVVTQTSIADSLPNHFSGTGLGAIRTGFILIGSLSPILIGTLGDFGYLNEGFMFLAMVSIIGLFFSALLLD